MSLNFSKVTSRTVIKLITYFLNSVLLQEHSYLCVSSFFPPCQHQPHIAKTFVVRQLSKQAFQTSIIVKQQSPAHFEKGIIRSCPSPRVNTNLVHARLHSSSERTANGSPSPRDPTTASTTTRPSAHPLPAKNDASVLPVHTSIVEPKKHSTFAYLEHYFVLTPSEFLLDYTSSDPAFPGADSPFRFFVLVEARPAVPLVALGGDLQGMARLVL
jgi:hypothetical protein